MERECQEMLWRLRGRLLDLAKKAGDGEITQVELEPIILDLRDSLRQVAYRIGQEDELIRVTPRDVQKLLKKRELLGNGIKMVLEV